MKYTDERNKRDEDIEKNGRFVAHTINAFFSIFFFARAVT